MRELELRVANRALKDSEERLRLALQAGRMFAWERNLSDDFVTRSDSAFDLIGLGSGPASEFDARVYHDDRWRAPMWGNCDQEEEIRYVRPDGEIVWLSARSIAVPEEGKPTRLIGVTFDITDRKRTEQELWRMANHDALTGLANRTLFQRALKPRSMLRKRTGQASAFCCSILTTSSLSTTRWATTPVTPCLSKCLDALQA